MKGSTPDRTICEDRTIRAWITTLGHRGLGCCKSFSRAHIIHHLPRIRFGESVSHRAGFAREVVFLDQNRRTVIGDAVASFDPQLIHRLRDPPYTRDKERMLNRFVGDRISAVEGFHALAEEVARLCEAENEVSFARVLLALNQHRKHIGHAATLSLDGIIYTNSFSRYAVKPRRIVA